MRNLDFTSDSPQSIKLGDSNDTLSLRVTELNQPVDLSKASSIAVKIGNVSGFLTEINVDVASLLHPTDGRIDVVINGKISSELPAGDYLLEVWINDAQGNTVIYPDTSYPTVIGFSIKQNIMAATSTVITTITLADFEAKFDDMQKDLQGKVASGYFKGGKGDPGEKGDTGTVDNTGLISAPAFQSLQTQVNNSTVGTNLLLGTGNNLSITGTNSVNQITDNYLLTNGYNVSTLVSALGTQFTISYDWSVSGSSPSGTFNSIWNTSPWYLGGSNTVSSSNTSGHFSYAFNLSADSKNIATGVHFRLDKFVGTLTISNVKLEKGNVVTDWCPNPAEILTQSDYAKIKAAIIALGGALS